MSVGAVWRVFSVLELGLRPRGSAEKRVEQQNILIITTNGA